MRRTVVGYAGRHIRPAAPLAVSDVVSAAVPVRRITSVPAGLRHCRADIAAFGQAEVPGPGTATRTASTSNSGSGIKRLWRAPAHSGPKTAPKRDRISTHYCSHISSLTDANAFLLKVQLHHSTAAPARVAMPKPGGQGEPGARAPGPARVRSPRTPALPAPPGAAALRGCTWPGDGCPRPPMSWPCAVAIRPASRPS